MPVPKFGSSGQPLGQWSYFRGSQLLALGIQTLSLRQSPKRISAPALYVLAFVCFSWSWLACRYIGSPKDFQAATFGVIGTALLTILVGILFKSAAALIALCVLFGLGAWLLHALFHNSNPSFARPPKIAWFAYRWLTPFGLMLLNIIAVSSAGLIFPISLLVAGWFVGWESGDTHLLERDLHKMRIIEAATPTA